MKITSNININSNTFGKMHDKKCVKFDTANSNANENQKKLNDSLNVLSSFNRPFVNRKIEIKPQPFFDETFGLDRNNILNSSDKIQWKFVKEKDNSVRIKYEYNPKILKIWDKQVSVDHISNLSFPYGSLAISSDLNGFLSTDNLWQCAGVAIVDKKHDLQTLLHFCPLVPTAVNEKLLEHILNVSNPKNLEVTIVPGALPDTDLTIDYLFSKIDETAKGAKIKFANFPDNEHQTLILHQGKLFASDFHNVIKHTNPVDKLSVATSFFI